MKCTVRILKIILAVLIIILCVITGIKIRQNTDPKDVVSIYETSNYNQGIYTGELIAENLCVSEEDVAMEGAPNTEGLHAAALFDLNNQKVNFSYHIYDRLYPASTTKLMTALVAIKNANLSDMVTVSANASSDNFAPDESVCHIKTGDQMTLKDLLYGLLLHSGNDNAIAIAEYVGGSVENFTAMMNQEAANLMATGSHFMNPHGLHDENHYTTAYDLYLIFNECMKYQDFIEIINKDSYTVNITGSDGTVRQEIWETSHYYAQKEATPPENVNIIGGKTGTTELAGNCLVLLEEDLQGNPYISIIMGAETKDLLYQDMTALMGAGIPK